MKSWIAWVFLLSAATASFADEGGFYAGAGLGRFDVKIDTIEDLADEFDSDDASFKVFGGWRFGRFVAAELAYINFGEPDETLAGSNVEVDLDGVAPFVIGTLPLGPLEIFARAGYLFYDLDVHVAGERVGSQSGSSEDFIYGGGLGITLLEHLNASVAYEEMDISGLDTSRAIWLTGEWRF